jgi:hypothetical protein
MEKNGGKEEDNLLSTKRRHSETTEESSSESSDSSSVSSVSSESEELEVTEVVQVRSPIRRHRFGRKLC